VLIACLIKQHDSSCGAILITHILILSAQHLSFVKKKIENQVLLYFGKLSYCIYLLHIPIGLISATLFVNLAVKITAYNKWVHLTVDLLAMFITVIASHWLYILVEKKSIALSKKIQLK
jgi:peptidoglycan/LPS O-acetylase OafA/YrhL